MSKCICEGNWRNIVKKSEPYIGKLFTDPNGELWRFFGLVHGGDDYYYGMTNINKESMLLSCVCDLETWDYELSKPPITTIKPS